MTDLILRKLKYGRAVFANNDFKKGDKIIDFRGKIYLGTDNPRGWNSKNNYYLQIDNDLYLGPTKTFDNYLNHSCNPNSGVKIDTKVYLVAIRDIEKGEEITWDYSTTMDEDEWEMDCLCGYKKCRKMVRDFKYLPKDVQKKYIELGIVPKYILRKI